MLNLETEICACNSKSVGDIAACIKNNKLTSLTDVLQSSECLVGDKCESCQDSGTNNDGINIPLVLAMVKRGDI